MRNLAVPLIVAVGLTLAYPAAAATVLFCPFDSLGGWEVRTVGSAKVDLVGSPGIKRCARVWARPGTAFLTRELPIDAVKGGSVEVRCSARPKDVVAGPQVCSTAKVHLSVQTPSGIKHHSARMTGSSE